MPVPFNDLGDLHQPYREAFHAVLDEVLDASSFIGGPGLKAFEEAFAQQCGAVASAGVSSGTSALSLALQALGVKPGDEVATVPNTFIATTEAITTVGASIRFVDVDENANMDPQALEALLKSQPVKVVLPVHLHGRPADLSTISELSKRHGARLLCDGAQAHLATYGGRSIVAWADLTTYSFYPGKNLGALGDAGAVAGDDVDLVEQVRRLANHGRKEKYIHAIEGTNARMDHLQALFLKCKLPDLPEMTRRRQGLAARILRGLEGVGDLVLPRDDPQSPSVFHLLVVRTPERDSLQAHLQDRGIQTGIHYPVPLHLQPAYTHLDLGPGSFPVAEAQAQDQLSLPLFPTMNDEQVEEVIEGVRSFYGGS